VNSFQSVHSEHGVLEITRDTIAWLMTPARGEIYSGKTDGIYFALARSLRCLLICSVTGLMQEERRPVGPCLGHSLCADLPVLMDRSNFTFEPKWLFRFLTRISVKNLIHRSFLFPCHGFCAYLISSRQKFWVSGFRDSRCREPQSSRSPDLRYADLPKRILTSVSPLGYTFGPHDLPLYDRNPFRVFVTQAPDLLVSRLPNCRFPKCRNDLAFRDFSSNS
jgi:hypothetical protein